MERFSPELYLHHPSGDRQAYSVRIDYSREVIDRSKGDWDCAACKVKNFSYRPQCYKCHEPKPAFIQAQHFQRPDGSVHAMATSSCPLLVIHGLAANVDENLLANAVSKLLRDPNDASNGTGNKGPTKLMSTATVRARGAKEGSLHRVFLVRDRGTGDSWRYGFAEFFSAKVWRTEHQKNVALTHHRMLRTPWQSTRRYMDSQSLPSRRRSTSRLNHSSQ
jgi:hypothetical protein